MRIKNKTILALGLMACAFSLSSCDSDSDDEIILQRPTALVTVYPSTSEGFILQLDDSTSLVPTNLKTSPFGEKKVRALVNYTVENTTGSDSRNVYVNWIDSIRTKQPVETQGSEDENVKVYGNDPIEIVKDWVSVAEDGYVTLRIRTLWAGNATHIINLVNGVNKDNVYEFDLRHNAQGDTNGKMGDALIAFDLNSLWKDQPKAVKIKLNWLSFSGKKSVEWSLKMHSGTAVSYAEAPSLLHRIE